jgi:hypothetical protein
MSQTAAEQMAQSKLAQIAFPRPYPSDLGQFDGKRGQLDVQLIGVAQTLNWQHYNSTSTSTDNIDTAISNMLSGADFVTEGNLSENTTQVSREAEYRPTWKRIEQLANLDDGGVSERWLAGVYRGDALDYFEADETDVDYFRDMKRGQRVILDAQNSMVPAPFVLPGRVVYTRDILAGQMTSASLRDDPRASFIESVSYNEDGAKLRGSRLRPDAVANGRLALIQILNQRKRRQQL